MKSRKLFIHRKFHQPRLDVLIFFNYVVTKIFEIYVEEHMFLQVIINDLYCLELSEELEVATGSKRETLLSHLGIEVNRSCGRPKKKTTKVYL